MADGTFDDLLLGLAQKHKGIEDLIYSILSFFERRTDFFHIMESPDSRMGFNPGIAERMMQKQFRFFQHRYLSRAQPHLLKGEDAPMPDRADVVDGEPGAPAATTTPSASADPAASGVPAAPAAASPARGSPLPDGVPPPPQDGGPVHEQTQQMRHISTWNGAATEKYYWSQTIYEVTVEVEVEKGARAKDMKVDLSASRLSVKCKGKLILEGKLHEKINTEDTMWHIDDDKLILNIEKQRQTWWKCVLEGDQEIDTTKVESTRTMDEYDGETQGAIRKIMFDQNQKTQGKATSDQLRTAEMMKSAWNAPGSPFRGTEFDPTMLNLSGPVPDDFFQDVEKKKLEEAKQNKDGSQS